MQVKVTVQATEQGCPVPKIGSIMIDDDQQMVEIEEVQFAYATNFGSTITFTCQAKMSDQPCVVTL